MKLPRSLSLSIDTIARSAIGRDWSLYAALMEHWAEIVGTDYAEVATPVKISFPKGKAEAEKWVQGHRTDGVLHIKVPQGLVLEFSCRTEQIQNRIAAFFGYPAIERIVFESFYGAPLPKAPAVPDAPLSPVESNLLKEQVSSIENNELRDCLERLGHSILSSNQK